VPAEDRAEENVALARAFAEAFNRGDADWILDHIADDIEFEPQRAATEGEDAFHGRDGMKRFLKDNEESFDVFHVSITETRSIEDRVVGVGAIRIRGKGSGIDTEVPTASVLTFRDGRITRFKDYVEREKALTAAGLS
jgi:ketosteroid isomerase-like protein